MRQEPEIPVRYRLIIYDLDGTLLDAFEDIRQALNFALEKCGLQPCSLEKVKSFVGDGITRLVQRALGERHHDRFSEVLPLVAQYYRDHLVGTSQVYPGVRETLAEIRKMGVKQAILTNKPHAIAVPACERVGLAQCVDRIQGEANGFPLKPDPKAALEIAKDFGFEAKDCLIVGDGRPDIELARGAGMGSVGCSWGMHTRAQIEALNPDCVIERVQDLIPIIRSKNHLNLKEAETSRSCE